MSVNVERVGRWVEALRSGEYEQGQGALRRAGGYFCCLGVACDLAAGDVPVGKWYKEGHEDPLFESSETDCSAARLTHAVKDYYGLPNTDPRVTPMLPSIQMLDLNVSYSLSELNDAGFTFGQIADLIEWAFLSEEAAV